MKDQDNKADEALEALFRRASVRQRAPGEREAEIREALRTEWGQLTRRRRVRKQVLVWASAASVVSASGSSGAAAPFKPRSTTPISVVALACIDMVSPRRVSERATSPRNSASR